MAKKKTDEVVEPEVVVDVPSEEVSEEVVETEGSAVEAPKEDEVVEPAPSPEDLGKNSDPEPEKEEEEETPEPMEESEGCEGHQGIRIVRNALGKHKVCVVCGAIKK